MKAAALRQSGAFTMVEILVVIIIVGLLVMIALPNFTGAQTKAHDAQVKNNMHTLQLAAESYSTDQAGVFATSVTQLAPYYPGGSSSNGGTAGNFPANPYTPGSNDLPIDGADVSSVAAARSTVAGGTSGNAGQCQYCQVPSSNHSSYAIVGMNNSGKSVAGDAGKQLVLSNE